MCIYTGDNTLILRETMKDLEKRLDPRRFQRVHRSTIVNLDQVRQVKPHTNGECFLVLDSGSPGEGLAAPIATWWRGSSISGSGRPRSALCGRIGGFGRRGGPRNRRGDDGRGLRYCDGVYGYLTDETPGGRAVHARPDRRSPVLGRILEPLVGRSQLRPAGRCFTSSPRGAAG